MPKLLNQSAFSIKCFRLCFYQAIFPRTALGLLLWQHRPDICS